MGTDGNERSVYPLKTLTSGAQTDGVYAPHVMLRSGTVTKYGPHPMATLKHWFVHEPVPEPVQQLSGAPDAVHCVLSTTVLASMSNRIVVAPSGIAHVHMNGHAKESVVTGSQSRVAICGWPLTESFRLSGHDNSLTAGHFFTAVNLKFFVQTAKTRGKV